ncbi:MAG: CidA/LrgA family protein [Erysipelotrichaceae bacterium]|nr:CidA/LrgA family protein [Erysipelotrichaceae bacterium]
MKIFKQLIIIIGITLIGNLLSYLLSLIHVGFPGAIIGLILLFILLLVKVIKEDDVNLTASFFIDNMGIFFVPATIAILNHLQIISENWWRFIVIILVAFVVSFTATYYAAKLTLYLQDKYGRRKQKDV